MTTENKQGKFSNFCYNIDLLSFALNILISFSIFIWGGLNVDKYYDTHPYGIVLGIILGLISTFREIFILIYKAKKQTK